MKKKVLAEIEATKYVLGQQRKPTRNERQTNFASPELTLAANVNMKTPHSQFTSLFNTKMNESEIFLQIVRASSRARRYVVVLQGK